MGAPRQALNPTTQSVGLTAKLVTVRSVSADGAQAVCIDRQNVQTTVGMLVQRSKAPLPQPGETWLLTQDLGMWTFAAIVATSAGQFITSGDGTGAAAGQRVTVAGNPPAAPSGGDVWVSGSAGNEVFWWSGTAWMAAQFGTPALADGAVTAQKIAPGTITSRQISPTAGITAGQVAFRASDIGGSRIVTGTAQPPDPVPGDLWINPSLGNQVSEWDGHTWTPVQLGAPAIQPNSLGSAQVNFTARDIGGITTSVGGFQPASPAVGDLWFSEAQDFALLQWNGSAWAPYQFGTGAIATGSITAALIAANTITATQIAAGTVVAGIVNGTLITGATLNIKNSYGAVILRIDGSKDAVFVYADTGSAIQGALIGSWAGISGFDPVNRTSYPQGFNVTRGAISGTSFTGTDFIINSSGAFFYNGAPAAGSLSVSIVSGSGSVTDPFGNVALAGNTTYVVVGGTALAVNQFLENTTVWSSTSQTAGYSSSITSNAISTLAVGGALTNITQTLGGNIVSTGGTTSNLTKISTDTLNTTTALSNSWTGTFTYQRMPDFTVKVYGLLNVPAGVGNPSVIFTMPSAPYIPTTSQPLTAVENGASPFAGNAKVCEVVGGTGAIHVYDAIAGETLRVFGSYWSNL